MNLSNTSKHRHPSCPTPMYAPRWAIPATRNRSSVRGPPLLPGRMLPEFAMVKLTIPAFGKVPERALQALETFHGEVLVSRRCPLCSRNRLSDL